MPVASHYFIVLCTIYIPMSKRENSTQNGPRAKRQRLPPGFRLARPVPSSSQESSSSSSSLFVTVSASARRRGNLTAGNRLLPSTIESSTPSSDSVSQPNDEEVPPADEAEAGELPAQDTETASKPKRKRFTKNVVRIISIFFQTDTNVFFSGPTHRMAPV